MPLNKLPRLRDPLSRDFVHEVKDLFLESYKEEPELYYKEDIKLVEDMQFLLQRCIIIKKKNVKESLNMLISMLKWRKEHRIRELTAQDFPVEYHMSGAAFVYEPDKFGNKTLYIRLQVLKSIPELRSSFKEFLAYLIYQVDDSVNGKSWSIICDLTNAGWTNYDIELMLHLLNLLKEVFPVNIDYVLAINFPWVLSAAWALAKRLIPAERRDAVIFIDHTEVFKYIEEHNVPDFLGGSCERTHQHSPKGCTTVVDYLLSYETPPYSAKQIREVIKSFQDMAPKGHLASMYQQLEKSGRQ